MVEDIISNIDYFGYMGLVGISDPTDKSVLFHHYDTEIPDFQFPENGKSILDPTKVDSSEAEQLITFYQNLIWKPLNEPLFQPDFETEFCHCQKSILDWNKDLASLVAIISDHHSVMQTFFPQMNMPFSKEDELKTA